MSHAVVDPVFSLLVQLRGVARREATPFSRRALTWMVEALQMLTFATSGFAWRSEYTGWIAAVARVARLDLLASESFEARAAMLALAVVLVAAVLGAVVKALANNAKADGAQTHSASLALLLSALRLCSGVLFLPLGGMLTGAVSCGASAAGSVELESTQECGSVEHILESAAGLLAFVCLVAVALLGVLASTSEEQTVDKAQAGVAHRRAELLLLLLKTVLLLAFAAPRSAGSKFALAALLVAAGLAQWLALAFFVPHYAAAANRLRATLAGAVMWAYLCTPLTCAFDASAEEAGASLVLLAGWPLACMCSYLVGRARMGVQLGDASYAYELEIAVRARLERLLALRARSVEIERAHSAAHAKNLGDLSDLEAERAAVLAERQGIAQALQEELAQAMRQFPHSVYVRLVAARFNLYAQENAYATLLLLREADTLGAHLDELLSIHFMRHDMDELFRSDRDGSAVLSFLEYTAAIAAAREDINLIRKLHVRFWSEMQQEQLSTERVEQIGEEINHLVCRCQAAIERALEIFGDSPNLLRLHAEFLEEILNDPVSARAAADKLAKVEELRQLQDKSAAARGSLGTASGKSDTSHSLSTLANVKMLFDDRSAVLTVSDEEDSIGVILSANSAACSMLGRTAAELHGSNVSIIMAPPFSDIHNSLMLNSIKRWGSGTPQARPLNVLVSHRRGHVFPARILVKHVATGFRRPTVIGVISQVDCQEGECYAFVHQKSGQLIRCSSSLYDLVGFSHDELLREDPKCNLRAFLPAYEPRAAAPSSSAAAQVKPRRATKTTKSRLPLVDTESASTVPSPNSTEQQQLFSDSGLDTHLLSQGRQVQAWVAIDSATFATWGVDVLRLLVREPQLVGMHTQRQSLDTAAEPQAPKPAPAPAPEAPVIEEPPLANEAAANEEHELKVDPATNEPSLAPPPSPSQLASPKKSALKQARFDEAGSVHSGTSSLTGHSLANALAVLRKALLNRSGAIDPSMQRLRLAFVFTCCALGALSIVSQVKIANELHSVHDLINDVGVNSLRRADLVMLAHSARTLQLVNAGLLQPAQAFEAQARDALALYGPQVAARSNYMFFHSPFVDEPHRQLYTHPVDGIRALLGAQVTESSVKWLGALNDYSAQALMLNEQSLGNITVSNPHAFFLWENFERVFGPANQTGEHLTRFLQASIERVQVLELGILFAALGLVAFSIIFVFRPAIAQVQDTKREVFQFFYELPLPVMEDIKLNIMAKTSDLVVQEEDRCGSPTAAGAEEAAGGRKSEQTHLLRKHHAAKIALRRQWRLFAQIVLLVGLAVAYFSFLYVAGMTEIHNAEPVAPAIDWTGRRRAAAVLLLGEAREALVAPFFADPFRTRSPAELRARAAERAEFLLRVSDDVVYGNEELGLDVSSGDSAELDTLLFGNACTLLVTPGCASFHRGVLTHGLFAAIAEYARLAGRLLGQAEFAAGPNGTAADVNAAVAGEAFTVMESMLWNHLLEHGLRLASQLRARVVLARLSLARENQTTVFAVFFCLVFALLLFLYEPLVRHLNFQLQRTRAMLLMIPSAVIEENRALRRKLMAAKF